jgi:hypothetical protein
VRNATGRSGFGRQGQGSALDPLGAAAPDPDPLEALAIFRDADQQWMRVWGRCPQWGFGGKAPDLAFQLQSSLWHYAQRRSMLQSGREAQMVRVFSLSEASYQRGSDYDIVMLYQVLLGRNPENSQVIQDHRTNPFNLALQTFISSPEFRESVLDPIAAGAPLRRHDIVPRPTAEQLNWLFGRTVLDDGQKAALRDAANWEQFFRYLSSLDGFLEPLPAPPPRKMRPPIPFKPSARPLAPPPPARPPIPIAGTLPHAQHGPSNADLMRKLDHLETMLADLARLLAGPASDAQSAAAAPIAMPAASAAPKAKPSSKRQAR